MQDPQDGRDSAAEVDRLRARVEEMEAFVRAVGHDLAAPARQVATFSHLVLAQLDEVDERALESLAYLASAAERLHLYVQQFSRLARLDPAEVEIVDVDLTAVLADAGNRVRPLLEGRGLEIDVADLPPVRGDAALLADLFAHLLRNSGEHARGREPIRVAPSTDPTWPEVTISVRDDGQGIPAAYHDAVFNPFRRHATAEGDRGPRQVPSTTTTSGGLTPHEEDSGAGLGLTAARSIARVLGGEVRVRESSDAGTTVHVLLHDARSRP